MLPILRYAKVFLQVPRRPRLGIRDDGVIAFRVWPNDLDLNGHLTNSRYFALMDAARYDMVIRSGIWKRWREQGWHPVVASQRIRFRKSLAPWTRYLLRSRLLGWDERNLYIGQSFEAQDGTVFAEATIRAALLRKDGRRVPIDAIMRSSGWTGDAPVLPSRVKAWVEAELADG